MNAMTQGAAWNLAGPIPNPLSAPAALARRILTHVAERRRDRLAADQLRSFTDAQLKDIGLTRGQIEFAVRGATDPRYC